MLIGLFQSIVIFMTGILYYISDFWLIHQYDKLRKEGGTGRSWGYTLLMLAGLLLLTLQPIFLPGLAVQIHTWWGGLLQGIGVILIIGALILHWWSRAHLQQFYVEDVVVLENHQLVDTGPYQYVRHPVFLSFFVIVIGVFLVNPSLISLLGAIYVFIDFPQAARRSEALLSKELDGYVDYMQRTGRFLPLLRKRE